MILPVGVFYHNIIFETTNELRLHRWRFRPQNHHIIADAISAMILEEPSFRPSAAEVWNTLQPIRDTGLCYFCKAMGKPPFQQYDDLGEHASRTEARFRIEEPYANDPNGILEHVPSQVNTIPNNGLLGESYGFLDHVPSNGFLEHLPSHVNTYPDNGHMSGFSSYGILEHIPSNGILGYGPKSESAFGNILPPSLALDPLGSQSWQPGVSGWAPAPTRATRRERSSSPRIAEGYNEAPTGQPQDRQTILANYQRECEHISRLRSIHGLDYPCEQEGCDCVFASSNERLLHYKNHHYDLYVSALQTSPDN
jgi:hypothetical protein